MSSGHKNILKYHTFWMLDLLSTKCQYLLSLLFFPLWDFSSLWTLLVLRPTIRIAKHTKPPGYLTIGGALEADGCFTSSSTASILPLQRTWAVCRWGSLCQWAGCAQRCSDVRGLAHARWRPRLAHIKSRGLIRGFPVSPSPNISCLQLRCASWLGINYFKCTASTLPHLALVCWMSGCVAGFLNLFLTKVNIIYYYSTILQLSYVNYWAVCLIILLGISLDHPWYAYNALLFI